MDKIIWYGERGVVDSLVYSLIHTDQSRKYLEKVKWVGGGQHEWISKVTSVTWLIEVGLSRVGFGDPDIILVCTIEEDELYFVFILFDSQGPFRILILLVRLLCPSRNGHLPQT